MKRDKIIYWITTSIVALGGLIAGIIYLTSPMVAERFTHLGFPDYFRIELATAKILGSIAIILPMFANRIKEWVNAGFAIVFISATISNLVVDGATEAIKSINSIITFSYIVCLLYQTK